MTDLTRCEVRSVIAKSGMHALNINLGQIYSLHQHINHEMIESGVYNGTMRMNEYKDANMLTCRTNEWDSREVVTFNRDGFIGIAGWASGKNVQPILKGIVAWVREWT